MTESPRHHLLSPELRSFYNTHKVGLSVLLGTSSSDVSVEKSPFLYRFIRLNPRFPENETLHLLKNELHGKYPIRIPWLPDDKFYALPGNFALSSSTCFQSGRIYGMDVSSGAAVSVLLSDRYEKNKQSTISHSSRMNDDSKADPIRVLDLCCCPGLKLCTIADRVAAGSIVVGVDTSENRMALCSKIIQKYHIESATSNSDDSSMSKVKIQLYCQDGTTFETAGVDHNLTFDSRVAMEDAGLRGNRKRKNKSARARERKRLEQIVSEESVGWLEDLHRSSSGANVNAEIQKKLTATHGPCNPAVLYDRVLVDAECSTDGSLKHVRERLKEAKATTQLQSDSMLADKNQLDELLHLQRRLAASGFRLLRPGGKLVYSTCSLSQDQNEKIVQWLLDQHKDAYLIPLQFQEARGSKFVQDGSLTGTVRFYPNIGQDPNELFGDGFFVAKIGKQEVTVE